jgi:UDP-N-acetylglucosamine:LPS N-acetylglucosamine transferase
MKKIVAVASAGGHWIQLLRLRPAFINDDVTFMCTKPSFATTVEGYKYFTVPDANRRGKLQLIYSFFLIVRKIWEIKPDVIITTGAAPGLMALAAGKLTGAKTIWVDSIANGDTISLSGKLASKIADRVYTQWEHLATSRIHFNGNVL